MAYLSIPYWGQVSFVSHQPRYTNEGNKQGTNSHKCKTAFPRTSFCLDRWALDIQSLSLEVDVDPGTPSVSNVPVLLKEQMWVLGLRDQRMGPFLGNCGFFFLLRCIWTSLHVHGPEFLAATPSFCPQWDCRRALLLQQCGPTWTGPPASLRVKRGLTRLLAPQKHRPSLSACFEKPSGHLSPSVSKCKRQGSKLSSSVSVCVSEVLEFNLLPIILWVFYITEFFPSLKLPKVVPLGVGRGLFPSFCQCSLSGLQRKYISINPWWLEVDAFLFLTLPIFLCGSNPSRKPSWFLLLFFLSTTHTLASLPWLPGGPCVLLQAPAGQGDVQ